MTELERNAMDGDDPRPVIAAIKAKEYSVYYIAKVMRLYVTQIRRMETTGRCQPHQLTKLREILADVTSQTVTSDDA